jgi:carbamate kinase
MVWTLFFTYNQNKQKKKLHDITIAHETDQKQRKAFQHVEKEFGSLFQREEAETEYTDDQDNQDNQYDQYDEYNEDTQ